MFNTLVDPQPLSNAGTYHPTVIGWIVFFFGLVLINRTKTGHTIIFYALILILIYLLIGNYARLVPILSKRGATP